MKKLFLFLIIILVLVFAKLNGVWNYREATEFLSQALAEMPNDTSKIEKYSANSTVYDDLLYISSEFGGVTTVEFVDYYMGHYSFNVFFKNSRIQVSVVKNAKGEEEKYFPFVIVGVSYRK